MSSKTKTIISDPPMNTNIIARTRCMGIGLSDTCRERATCQLHQDQMADPSSFAMKIGRVGNNACYYRKEARPAQSEALALGA